MRRKAHIIAILALGLTATLAGTSPVLSRLVCSARTVQRDAQTGETLSPLERFVFSLVLSDARPAHISAPRPF
jgi:hypothetical protein